MKKVFWLLTVALSFYAGMKYITHAYNPDNLRIESAYLAANSYLYGCTANKGKNCKEMSEKYLQDMLKILK